MAQRFSYDDVYKVYAWREDNIAKLVLTQGEGLSDSASSFTNTYVKTAKFQLRDDRGVIAIPSNNSATLALEKSDGSEALIEMFTSYTDSTGLTADKNNGIVTFAIKRSMTDVPGEMKGEIRLTTSTGIIKFYGIKFYVYNGISDAAAEQSEAFSALVSYTNKVAALLEHEGDYGNLASLDDTIIHGGVNPATSGVIFDFVDGNYMRYKSISGAEADTANDARAIYTHHVNGGFRGLVFFVGYNNYNVSTTVRQFRLCKNGRFEYRDGTVITPTVTPNTYTWDKTYDEDWKPIGSTQNIQDLAVTTAKLANQAVTSAKIGNGEVKTTNIDSNAVTSAKIADGNVTSAKIGSSEVKTANIENSAVTTAKIADGAVTEAKIADYAVKTNKLASGSVTTQKIEGGAVTTLKLADSAVTTNKIDTEAVTTEKLAGGAVSTGKLADKSVTKAKIADGAVDTAQLAFAAVTTDNIDSNAVGTDEMADGAVTTSKLAASSVTTAKIADGSITPEKLSKTYIDHTPEIFIGTTDKPVTEDGTSTKQYTETDRYINKYNGKIWVCTNAVQTSEILPNNVPRIYWQYTWSEKGNFYNYPAQVSYPLNKNAWSNNQIELSGQLWAVADGRKRVDVDIDQATYLQLCADGCAGLFVSTDDSGSTPVFTMNAIGNVPTTDITVQLTLWHVIEL